MTNLDLCTSQRPFATDAKRSLRLASVAASAMSLALAGCAATRIASFTPSQNQVAVQARVGATSLTFLLDTAVTPSIIDLKAAHSVRARVDRTQASDASGTGSGKASVFPVEMPKLRLGTVRVANLEAFAADLSGLSAKFGQRLDGILGDSFLRGRMIGIDYVAGTVHAFHSRRGARMWTAQCSTRHMQAMELVPGDIAPLLRVDIGGVQIPVSLDTGSALQLELYGGALAHPQIASAIGVRSPRTVTGARGESLVSEAPLTTPVMLGQLRWDQVTVTLSGPKGSAETRLGNLGNQLLRGTRLLLNYKDMELGLFQNCARLSGHTPR